VDPRERVGGEEAEDVFELVDWESDLLGQVRHMCVDDLKVAVHKCQMTLHFANQSKGGLHQALQLLDVALHGHWRRRTARPTPGAATWAKTVGVAIWGHVRDVIQPRGRPHHAADHTQATSLASHALQSVSLLYTHEYMRTWHENMGRNRTGLCILSRSRQKVNGVRHIAVIAEQGVRVLLDVAEAHLNQLLHRGRVSHLDRRARP